MTSETQALHTNAWCYLNLNNPVCAWAAYRGVLVQAPLEPGFLSVWMASMLSANGSERLAREFALEAVRARMFSDHVSRLRGMYVFIDERSAKRATAWGGPFVEANLTELNLAEARVGNQRYDSNWITHQPSTAIDDSVIPDWMPRYWRGEPHPDHEPLWEVLAEGRLVLLGTELRRRAFERIRTKFPDSLALLESARLAAWVGSDLGNISAFLRVDPTHVTLDYLLDMRSAGDKELKAKIADLMRSGHPVNRTAIGSSLSIGAFVTPDLRPYGFRRPHGEMRYVLSAKP